MLMKSTRISSELNIILQSFNNYYVKNVYIIKDNFDNLIIIYLFLYFITFS
jgi:hypothetical protein